MFHSWLSSLDSRGNTIRIILLDFSKAFDRINLNILIVKLIDMGVRPSLIKWLCNFLSDRKQRVKLGKSFSSWINVKAGVPQGTKLGPLLFLVMVNDLKPSNVQNNHWKYVDDMSISEVVSTDNNSVIQQDLDHIVRWANEHYMTLNSKKCKELRISFVRDPPVLPQAVIGEKQIEIVDKHKVLGFCIQDDFKWDAHVEMIVKKASKRLHIIRILKRNGMPPEDLVTIYISLVRSVLEYGCIV